MYATSSDKLSSIARTGSHATKHSATGKGGVLPPEAEPWAIIFNDLKKQRELTMEQVSKVAGEIGDLNWRLKNSSDPRDQAHMLTKRRALSAKTFELDARLSSLKEEITLAARSSVGWAFLAQARAMLPSEQFSLILAKAKDIIEDDDLVKKSKTKDLVEDGYKRPEYITPAPLTSEQQAAQRARARDRERTKHFAKRFGIQGPAGRMPHGGTE